MKRVYLLRRGLPEFPNGIRMCLGRTNLPLPGEKLRKPGLTDFKRP